MSDKPEMSFDWFQTTSKGDEPIVVLWTFDAEGKTYRVVANAHERPRKPYRYWFSIESENGVDAMGVKRWYRDHNDALRWLVYQVLESNDRGPSWAPEEPPDDEDIPF